MKQKDVLYPFKLIVVFRDGRSRSVDVKSIVDFNYFIGKLKKANSWWMGHVISKKGRKGCGFMIGDISKMHDFLVVKKQYRNKNCLHIAQQ